jgi:hypothetical protein
MIQMDNKIQNLQKHKHVTKIEEELLKFLNAEHSITRTFTMWTGDGPPSLWPIMLLAL